MACGIWGAAAAALAGQSLPLVPVAHPYVYGPAHAAPVDPSPFVRCPDLHVYVRDHGERFGLGTYDHAPVAVDPQALGPSAEEPWRDDPFDAAVDRALDLLPAASRFAPHERLSGIYSVTPDNLPLLGASDEISGLWFAEAIWVTHAGGAARALAAAMLDPAAAPSGLDALRPGRFAGRPREELASAALARYRGIYAAA